MAELTPLQARYSDKVAETQSALWSALLTAEAIFLSLVPLLSADRARTAPALWTAFVAAGLVSCVLLVWNFVATRNVFLKIGQILHEVRRRGEDDVAAAARLHGQNRTRERLTLVLMSGQLALILIANVSGLYR